MRRARIGWIGRTVRTGRSSRRYLIFLAVLGVLTACGKSGGSSGSTPSGPTAVNLNDFVEIQSETLRNNPTGFSKCLLDVRVRNLTQRFLSVSLVYRFFGAGGNELGPGGVVGTLNGGETKVLTGGASSSSVTCAQIARFELNRNASLISN